MDLKRLHQLMIAATTAPFALRRTRTLLLVGLVVGLVLLCFDGWAQKRAPSGKPAGVEARAMHLLHENCIACHGPEKQSGGLRLDTRSAAAQGGDSGTAFVAGRPSASVLRKVLEATADPHMPPKKQLPQADLDLVSRWIKSGARWDEKALAAARAPKVVELSTLPPGYRPTFALAFSPDGARVVAGRGLSIALHDVGSTNGPTVTEKRAHRDVVRAIAWHPSGKQFASGSFREVTLWDATTLQPIWTLRSNLVDRIASIRFAKDGAELLIADGAVGRESLIRVLDSSDGRELRKWPAHSDSVYAIDISDDGNQVATAGHDALIKLWDFATGKEQGRLEGHAHAVTGIAFNRTTNELVSVSADKQLKVWDIRSRQSVVDTAPKKHGFTAVDWSRDGKRAVAATTHGAIIAFTDFKRHTGAQSSDFGSERELLKAPEPIQSVAISPNGDVIGAGAQNGTIYLLNTTGKVLQKLEAMPAPILAATVAEKTRESSAPSFVRDILPELAKAGCMAGSCHAKAEGQNGFALTVFSYDPSADYAEITQEGHGRRVFPAAPQHSLLLLKPTLSVAHEGGQRFEVGSRTYNLLAEWIQGGMIFQHPAEPGLARVVVSPQQPSFKRGASKQLRVQAHYSDGSIRDVTHLSDFISHDKEIAQVSERGLMRVGTLTGQGVVVARYMGMVDAVRVTIPAQKTVAASAFKDIPVYNFIDEVAYGHFQKLGLLPSELCTDSEFLRRASLDTIGKIPTPEETRAFLADTDPKKRQKWVEHLLEHPAYADYWANKWADLVRPNPDRVGIKSVFVLDQWLREAFRNNMPYDQFARSFLTVEGSNHREGPAVVYRDRREPPELTTMFSQLFLGTRMECAKCHHHPNEKWTQDDFYQLAAFFGPVKQKGAGLSPPISAGFETFYFAEGGSVKHPVSGEAMKPRPLAEATFALHEKQDPRRQLADWLTNPANPFFARAAVNRVWANFFGRGFVEPVDDFRVSNPPSNEPVLDALAKDFAAKGYDQKQLIRTILNSRLYQLSSTPNERNLRDTKNFARSYRRRLPAEALLDVVNDVVGATEKFEGAAPGQTALQTWSYKIDSHFMDAFGRPNPSSDCPCERDTRSSVVQSLHMMNSRALQSKLSGSTGRVKQLVGSDRSPEEIVTELYLAALNRFPSEAELKIATAPFLEEKANRQTAAEDVLWSLLNSVEFVFNH